LDALREELKDLADMFVEPPGAQFFNVVDSYRLYAVDVKVIMTNQVVHNIARGTDNNLGTVPKSLFTTSNAGVALSLCVLGEIVSDLLNL
jgi:hypothetical protein